MKGINDKLLATGGHYVVLYDNGEETVLHDKGGVYYGVSWNKDNLFILWRNFKNGEIILVFDRRFRLVDQIHIGKFIDGHQILCTGDKLFVTNTHENSLIEINLTTRTLKDIRLTPYSHDHNHVNGLTYIDERSLWILFSNGKIDKNSEINKYDIYQEKIVESIAIGNQIHNYIGAYLTSSYDFKVYKYDRKTGNIVQSIELDGWIRGMDLLNGGLAVGSSAISFREERKNKDDGKLYFLDKNLNLTDAMIVPGIGQINDVRTIGSEYSHNNALFVPTAKLTTKKAAAGK